MVTYNHLMDSDTQSMNTDEQMNHGQPSGMTVTEVQNLICQSVAQALEAH